MGDEITMYTDTNVSVQAQQLSYFAYMHFGQQDSKNLFFFLFFNDGVLFQKLQN